MNRASLPKDTLIDLMAYADGELDDSERARIEKLLGENPEAKRFLDSLTVLGAHVREAADREPVIAIEGIADTVMARIEREERKAPTQKRIVVDLAQARAERAKVVGTPQGSGWKLGVAVAAALALAASAIFMMRGEQQTAHNEAPKAPQTAATQQGPSLPSLPSLPKESVLAAIGEGVGVDVEKLDAPQAVSVFYVPAINAATNSNASSVVVWIEDEVKP